MSQDIITPPQDGRPHKYIKLENELKVLLVQDSEAETSAACMFVGVGSLDDPDHSATNQKINGMAHFCEHMLFLGTKKYPEENYYQKFVKQNGGDSNAATGEEYTYFYYNVSGDKFEESLDIFS